MTQAKRLIEVAMPIREISAESGRDKSLRHGHPCTLHMWWARRPLPACRAVTFASVVPDPDDPDCPKQFRNAVARYLRDEVPGELRCYKRGSTTHNDPDPYAPYSGVEDTLRNRLLMFIAKWSPETIEFDRGERSKSPPTKYTIDERSLVKWEVSDPENPQGRKVLEVARELIEIGNGGQAPTVLDPFAGGGAIPLEAGRLGCNPIANDYNPVAYLLLRGTCELPQKYGHPGTRTQSVAEYGEEKEREVEVENVLSHDVEKWAHWILNRAEDEIGHLYPMGEDGRRVIAYFWARTAPCSNPSCQGEMPLLRTLNLCSKSGKKVALTMDVDRDQKTVQFGIAHGKRIEETNGTMQRGGNVLCPYCEQITPVEDLRTAGQDGHLGERMVAVILNGENGKDYRPVKKCDLQAFKQAADMNAKPPGELILQEVTSSDQHVSHRGQFTTYMYGMRTWGSLFNPRQLVAMHTFVECVQEAFAEMRREMDDEDYRRAVVLYLGLWVSKMSDYMASFTTWTPSGEFVGHVLTKQAVPMVWDYPEVNPFNTSTGGARSMLDWMIRVINREKAFGDPATVQLGDAGDPLSGEGAVQSIVTDPPYFDAIAYADLSDFFYVWLKRALGHVMPNVFVTPLTPKQDEATALKHRHGGDGIMAEAHFRSKLAGSLSQAREAVQDNGLIAVMFAHQSSKAWTALVEAIFAADLTIDASWPIDTERSSRTVAIGTSSLASSVTVVCRPREPGSAASYRRVRREVEAVVGKSVQRFWDFGLRGADLIVASYGPAVSVFGQFERVEKADGTPVEIPELLELAREAARDEIAGEFRGDNLSTLYYVWANLYGTAEQQWDDARLVVQIGGDAESAMELARRHGIFQVDGSDCRLGLLKDRKDRANLGLGEDPPLIDALHRAMKLWQEEKRDDLVTYLARQGLLDDGRFWKLAQALYEVLPRECQDWKLTNALLTERESLQNQARSTGAGKDQQGELF